MFSGLDPNFFFFFFLFYHTRMLCPGCTTSSSQPTNHCQALDSSAISSRLSLSVPLEGFRPSAQPSRYTRDCSLLSALYVHYTAVPGGAAFPQIPVSLSTETAAFAQISETGDVQYPCGDASLAYSLIQQCCGQRALTRSMQWYSNRLSRGSALVKNRQSEFSIITNTTNHHWP